GKSAEELDEQSIEDELYTRNLPDLDLLVRTSGELRISNFLLWQSAYAEIYVTDTLWPDFRRLHLLQAIVDYQQRSRRFGGLKLRREKPFFRQTPKGGTPNQDPLKNNQPNTKPKSFLNRLSPSVARVLTAVVLLPILIASILVDQLAILFCLLAATAIVLGEI